MEKRAWASEPVGPDFEFHFTDDWLGDLGQVNVLS